MNRHPMCQPNLDPPRREKKMAPFGPSSPTRSPPATWVVFALGRRSVERYRWRPVTWRPCSNLGGRALRVQISYPVCHTDDVVGALGDVGVVRGDDDGGAAGGLKFGDKV